jgi:hypothetical protein
LVKAEEWAKMGRGDFQTIARTSIGTAMVGTAIALRYSEYAGEKPWEFRLPGQEHVDPLTGEIKYWDTSPYNPFMNYFVLADVFKRWKEGKGHTIDPGMIIKGVMGQSMKMKGAATIADDALQALVGEGDEKKVTQRMHEFFAGAAGSWAVPLQTYKDYFDSFVASPMFEDTSIPYEAKHEAPITQEFTSRIPGRTPGEPLYSATHAGPVMRERPAFRQSTGITIKTKNPFEQELDKFGYNPAQIFKSTGLREADNLIKKNMGEIVQTVFVPMVRSEEYQALTDEQKDFLINDVLREARSESLSMLAEQNPKLHSLIKAGKISKKEERLQKSQGINIKKEIEEAFKK